MNDMNSKNPKVSIFKTFIATLISSIVITLFIMTGSFLLMMFSSGEDGHREALFNTIFFESTTATDGTLNISFGLTERYMPLLVIAGVIFLLLFSTCIVYGKLQRYKEKLLAERNQK